jgi:hypothetical protein
MHPIVCDQSCLVYLKKCAKFYLILSRSILGAGQACAVTKMQNPAPNNF